MNLYKLSPEMGRTCGFDVKCMPSEMARRNYLLNYYKIVIFIKLTKPISEYYNALRIYLRFLEKIN